MTTEKKFQIPDIMCSNCVMHLEAIEDELPGVTRVEGSYQKQSLLVVYDESIVQAADIIQAIQKKGYTVATD